MLDVVTLRERARTTFSALSRTSSDHLRWVTTVISAYVVGLDDDVSVQICAAVEAYHGERYRALRQTGYVRRHASGQTRWAGVIEIDLVHPQSECSQGKRSLLRDLGVDFDEVNPDQRIIVLHEHAVYDCRGHISPQGIMTVLRGAFPGYRRIHAAVLHNDHTVSENLTRLSGYSTKMRCDYSDSMNDRATKFAGVTYEPEWRDYVNSLYHHLGVDRMISANISVQRNQSKSNPRRTISPNFGECKTDNFIGFSPENSENNAKMTTFCETKKIDLMHCSCTIHIYLTRVSDHLNHRTQTLRQSHTSPSHLPHHDTHHDRSLT